MPLTVGEIKKAVANLNDACEVKLCFATNDEEAEDILVRFVVPCRAFRDVLNDELVIEVEDSETN